MTALDPANRLPPPVTFGEFWERVAVLCAIYSGSWTSGARTEARNAVVGGSSRSYHRLRRGGRGCDVVLDEMSPAALGAFGEAARQCGLDAIDEGDHIHLEPARA